MTKEEINFYAFWVENEEEKEEVAEWVKEKSEEAEAERNYYLFDD